MYNNRIFKAHIAVLFTNFIFGVNYSVVKLISPEHIHPLALNMARILVAFLMFWGLFLIKPSKNPPIGIDKKDIPRFIVCASTGVVLNQVFFLRGLSLTSPIHASLLALITPILIVFIAAWMVKETLSLLKITGLCVAVAGAVILIAGRQQTLAKDTMFLGDIYVMINAVFYSLFMVWAKPLMQKYNPLHVVRWIFTFGFIMIVPFAGKELYDTQWHTFSEANWTALSIVCVGATFISYLFNAYGIAVIGSSNTGVYIYTQPLFAAIIAMIFMGETLGIQKLLAALLIFIGVYMVSYQKRSIVLMKETSE